MDQMNRPMAGGESKKGMPNIWLYASIVLAVALIALAVVAVPKLQNQGGENFVSGDQAANALVSFINEVYGPQVGQATLKEVTEKNGLYQVVVTVTSNGQPLDQTVFVTKDAKIFIPQIVDIAQLTQQYKDFQQQQGSVGTVPTPSPEGDTAPTE